MSDEPRKYAYKWQILTFYFSRSNDGKYFEFGKYPILRRYVWCHLQKMFVTFWVISVTDKVQGSPVMVPDIEAVNIISISVSVEPW